MGKLHEVLAIEGELSAVFKKLLEETKSTFVKKSNLFQGQVATYTANDEARSIENNTTQQDVTETVSDKLDYVFKTVEKYFDCNYQKEAANQHAVADIILTDGTDRVLGTNMPATFLLGLESKLKAVRDVLDSIPTRPPGVSWVEDSSHKMAPNIYKRLDQTLTIRTEKTIKPIILAPATDKHPAQVEKVTLDVPVGKTVTTHYSGMISAHDKSLLLDRCDAVIRAVKQARQRANEVEVPKASTRKLLDYILGRE